MVSDHSECSINAMSHACRVYAPTHGAMTMVRLIATLGLAQEEWESVDRLLEPHNERRWLSAVLCVTEDGGWILK